MKYNSKILNEFDVVTLNLIVKRHHLSEEKREMFGVRWASDDPQLEAEMTKDMDRLTNEIAEVDAQLLEYGIDSKKRPQIVKELKKEFPDSWFMGFIEDKSETS